MANNESLLLAGAWIITYALHSTLLLGGAWLLFRTIRIRSDAVKEWVWQFALVGGVISATLQLGLGVEPVIGQFRFVHAGDAATGPEEGEIPSASQGDRRAAPTAFIDEEARAGLPPDASPLPPRLPAGEVESAGASIVAKPIDRTGSFHRSANPWPILIIGGCLIPMLLALLHFAWTWIRLQRILKDRLPIEAGPLANLLKSLCDRAGFRSSIGLTRSKRASIPMALGVFRPEICLPDRAIHGLHRSEQRSMLAHELAHLKRRDPMRLYLNRWLECVLFFQPLNRLGRKRWQEMVEYRCDAWAADLLGGGLSLARCLTEVADWLSLPAEGGCDHALVHGMAKDRSCLSRRVRRLLDESTTPSRKRVGTAWLILLPAVVLLMIHGAPGASLVEASMPRVENKIQITRPASAEDESKSLQSLIASFQSLSREIDLLDREIQVLRQMVHEAGLTEEVGALLESAETRILSLHSKREEIKALIRMVAQPMAQTLEWKPDQD